MFEITSGKIQRAKKTVVYGPEGIGKSTFASKFPNPLFSDTEGSTYDLEVARLPRPTSWTMLMQQAQFVKANPTICKTYVVDTADWAEQLCLNQICSEKQVKGIEDIGYGKGYIYLMEEFGRWLNLLEELINIGINVTIVAHAQMRKFEQPDEMGAYDRWELKLQKKTAPLLKEWADMILFANYKTMVINVDGQGATKGKNKVQGGQSVMYTTHHPCWDAKNRCGLPEEMPFDYSGIAHIIESQTQTNHATTPIVENSTSVTETPITTHSTVETATDIPQATFDLPKEEPPTPNSNIPKVLYDLMVANGVADLEIMAAVESKGYYPKGTPISNYDPSFIDGVLVGAWEQVFQIIREIRDQEGIQF